MTSAEFTDEFWFVERFTEKIKRLIPTRQQIHDSFRLGTGIHLHSPSVAAGRRRSRGRAHQEHRRIQAMEEQMQNVTSFGKPLRSRTRPTAHAASCSTR